MKNVFSYRKRAFLNPRSTGHTSYINVQVESSHGGKYKLGSNLIQIADCQRSIQLEFFLGTEQDRQISLNKIQLLVATLIDFRETLIGEIDLIEKRGE